jgi:cysteine dioxygenase
MQPAMIPIPADRAERADADADATTIAEALADVVHHFRRRSSDRGQRVARALAHPAFSVEALRDYLAEPGANPYGRRLVFQDEYIEVILMNWGANAVSLPHDHGQSEGWVRVLCGSALHGQYRDEEGEVRRVDEQRIATGTIFHAPVGLVHHMANATAQPLVTLHCYFPPIHRMAVFDLEAARTAIVTDDCGAWWPDSERQIVELRPLGALAEEAGNGA